MAVHCRGCCRAGPPAPRELAFCWDCRRGLGACGREGKQQRDGVGAGGREGPGAHFCTRVLGETLREDVRQRVDI